MHLLMPDCKCACMHTHTHTHTMSCTYYGVAIKYYPIINSHTHTHTHTVDATYEGIGKRTFLPLVIIAGALLLLLIGLMVLYPRLGQKLPAADLKSGCNENKDKEAILEAADEEEVTESSQLITEKD